MASRSSLLTRCCQTRCSQWLLLTSAPALPSPLFDIVISYINIHTLSFLLLLYTHYLMNYPIFII